MIEVQKNMCDISINVNYLKKCLESSSCNSGNFKNFNSNCTKNLNENKIDLKDEFMTIEEFSVLIKLKRGTVYKNLRDGSIPIATYYKNSKCKRLKVVDVENYINELRRPTKEEILQSMDN